MNWITLLKLFGPASSTVSINEKFISAIAALVAIALVMLVSQFFLDSQSLPWVVASMGASAVLLFAVPKGPLSQPWSFMAGHLISAFIGITIAKLVADPIIASALAVSLAIFFMYLTSCLHPPGGATALTAVVGGSAITELGYWYMLTPISVNILVMMVWAVIINNLLANRSYPNGLQELKKSSRFPAKKKKLQNSKTDSVNLLSRSDLHATLTEMDIFVDISENELSKIFNLSLMNTYKRKMGKILCGDIMSKQVITVNYDTEIEMVWQLMIEKKVHAFPVVDKINHVIGIISLTDFLNQINFNSNSNSGVISQLNNFIKKTMGDSTDKPEYAGHLMSKPAITIGAQQHILELFELFYSHNIHHLPVVDINEKLVGIITPKDLLLAFQNPNY